ncbi:MAG: serine hydrolase [Gemmatimonadaceae bacterium]|nr:serine hydrolase [Gemmatimonadaceae bacterium]
MIAQLLFAALQVQGADESLSSRIESVIAAVPGAQVAVAYVDSATGRSLYRNADSVYHAASTMKVPVMMELFRQAGSGGFSLDQPLLLVNEFRSIADGSPFTVTPEDDADTSLYAQLGTRVLVRDLLQRMITRSSNLATNQLIALVGAESVTAMIRRLGGQRMTVLRGVEDLKAFDRGMNNVATARDLAILLSAITQARAEIRAHSAEMLNILFAQEFNEKIPAGLPPGTRVAHKTGEITAHSHDAAIVYPANRKPYVLVVLTRGIPDAKVSAKLIADISRVVYQFAIQ